MKNETESIEFDIKINPDNFMMLNDADKKLTLESLSEKEKFENIGNFKTLENNKVGWNQ